MPNAAKTGIIFLVLGFVVYLAWQNDLETYLAFATKSASSGASAGGVVSSAVSAAQSAVNTAGTALQAVPGESYEYGEGG
jgi:hypothetical protein